MFLSNNWRRKENRKLNKGIFLSKEGWVGGFLNPTWPRHIFHFQSPGGGRFDPPSKTRNIAHETMKFCRDVVLVISSLFSEFQFLGVYFWWDTAYCSETIESFVNNRKWFKLWGYVHKTLHMAFLNIFKRFLEKIRQISVFYCEIYPIVYFKK